VLRVAGVLRWGYVVVALGGAVGLLIFGGVRATDDFRLSHRGIVVPATVRDVDLGEKPQYLLRYVIDGQPELRWTDEGLDASVGDTVPIIVDPDDHARFRATTTFGQRWWAYLILLLGSGFFGWLGVFVLRMDLAEFRAFAGRRRLI
jgi:hypothetical protein